MAGPWERFNAAAESGPWTKYEPPAAEPEGIWERGMILPTERNSQTGEHRWAVPQMLIDLGNAVQAPGKALSGEYGLEIDPATGRPTTITNAMIGDTMGLAGLGLGGVPLPSMASKAGIPALNSGARSIVQKGLRDAGVPFDQVAARLRAIGPDAMVADLGPRLQNSAAAVATQPLPGQSRMVGALEARQQGTNQRIIGDTYDILGPAAPPSQVHAEIRAGQDALSPDYERLFTNEARAVDTSPIALELDSMSTNLRGPAQKAAQNVRRMLNVTGVDDLDPNPYTLFQTRRAIDGILSTEQDPVALGTMKYIRGKVDEMLAQAIPGIKGVDAKFADLARQGEAFGAGQKVLESGRTAPWPEDVAAMVSGASPDILNRMSQGTRAEIERIIRTTGNDLNALKSALKGDGSWNRDRLATLFGADKADRLLNVLERERLYASTHGPALGGSRTQMLKAAQEDITGKGPRPNPVRSAANFRFGDAAADLADRGLGWAFNARRAATNSQLADLLSAGADSDLLLSIPQFRPNALQQGAPLAALEGLMLSGDEATRRIPWLQR